MGRFLTVVILSGVALAQVSSPGSKSATDPADPPAPRLEGALVRPPDLPSLPRGKSTVIGGRIRGLDRIRDQFTLNIFGGKTMKVLFDERTQLYRDGVRTPLHDLRAGDHVSVETSLDGTAVFARSIHMLSQSPEGECQGQVLKYVPGNGELIVRDVLSREPVKLRVSADTAIVRQGQPSSSANPVSPGLATGTLVSVKFQSDNKGHGVATEIAVLAAPGTAFVFVGNIISLDLHLGLLVMIDPRDNKRYEISFDSKRYPLSRDLHEGEDVEVTADFDGTRYVASAVSVDSVSGK